MVPNKSAGNKSGVNCKRLNLASIHEANDFMASVLANPGTPSKRICPLDSKAIKRRSTMCFCPTMVLSNSIKINSTKALSACIFSFNSLISVIAKFLGKLTN